MGWPSLAPSPLFMSVTVVFGLVFSVIGTVLTCISIYESKTASGWLVWAWFGWTTGNVLWFFYGLMIPDDDVVGVAMTGLTGAVLNAFVLMMVFWYWWRCPGDPVAKAMSTNGTEITKESDSSTNTVSKYAIAPSTPSSVNSSKYAQLETSPSTSMRIIAKASHVAPHD